MSATTSTPATNSVLEKAVLAITKLQGRDDWCHWSTTMKIALDHTWEYIGGSKATVPDMKDAAYDSWVIEDRNAHRRIWLALSDHVQDSVILHTDNHASKLFQALKSAYEFSGAPAEYYAQQDYDNTKISDYDSLSNFITALMNLTHLVNKEIQGTDGHIQEWHITMQIIHSLPPSM